MPQQGRMLSRLRLTEALCDEIERMIREGELKPGQRLPSERELADRFQVSRATVSKALAQLEARGLLRSYQGGGTFVTDNVDSVLRSVFSSIVLLNEGSIEQLLEVRRILEGEIAALAAERASPAHIDKLGELLDTMRASLRDATTFVEADLKFHLVLAQSTGNKILAEMLSPIQEMIRSQMKLGTRVPGAMERSIDSHQKLIDKIALRSPAEARGVMLEHLEETRLEVASAKGE